MFCLITKTLSLIQVFTGYLAPGWLVLVLDPQIILKYISDPCNTFITSFKVDISKDNVFLDLKALVLDRKKKH